MTNSTLMEMKKLSKRFTLRGTELNVLHELDCKIYEGDCVAIMGPSGAGKSTLLHVMGTLDTPTSGQILFQGEDVFQRSSAALAQFRNEQIGFVFQFHHLLPEFTALENVMLPGLIGRLRRTEACARAEELLDLVGLAQRKHHQPGELSGGEQQRVAIARALFMRPKLLLTDEPTGNLDLKTSAGIHGVLQDLNEHTGVTVVVVTHDPRFAELMPIQLFVDDGKLIPLKKGDSRIGDRLPKELLDREPSARVLPLKSSQTEDWSEFPEQLG